MKKIKWDKVFLALGIPLTTGVGILMDLAHYGFNNKVFNINISDIIRASFVWWKNCFSFCSLNYDSIHSVVENKETMAVTIFNIFISLSIGMAQRSETKFLGVTIGDINSEKTREDKVIMIENILIPLFMLIFLTLGFCFSAYVLFVDSILGLFYYSTKYRHSYDWKNNQKCLIEALAMYAGDVQDTTSDGFFAYRGLLENISWGVRKDSLWRHTEEFYFAYLEELLTKEYNVFFSAYFFFERIFCDNYKEEKRNVAHIIQQYLDSRKYENDTKDGLNDREREILWGMLYALSSQKGEEDLYIILNWTFDFGSRAQKWNQKYQTDFPEDKTNVQLVYLLIFIEIWMDETATVPSDRFVALLRCSCIYVKRRRLTLDTDLYKGIKSNCISVKMENERSISDDIDGIKNMLLDKETSRIYDLIN